MRILFFVDNFPPEVNAAASRVYERAVLWVKEGHEVTVVTSVPNFPQGAVHEGYRNRLRQVEFLDGIRVVRVWTFIAANEGIVLRTLDFLSYMITSFLVAFGERRPDIVTATSPQFFCALGGWAHARLRGLPFVFELSDLWPASIMAVGAMRKNFLIKLFEKLELFLYRHSDRIIALTQDFRRDLTARGIAPEKVVVVRNGVDLARYAPRSRDEVLLAQHGLENKFVLGYFGTHGMAHALSSLLDAAALLRDRAPRVHFLFVGDGAARRELLARLEVEKLPNVTMVGPRPKMEMPRWWSLADMALISLKKQELFGGVIPSKIFEAMGMGIPLLFVGPSGEASDILAEEDCGVVVPPERPEIMTQAAEALLADPARVATLRRNSRDAAPRYSRAVQADAMIAVYQSVLQHLH
jgi:glycosyltransferase involved in cell wall biosynthesis